MSIENGYAICFNKWLFDKEIKSELNLLLLISSLCAERGHCWANNEYFADLFQIDEVSVSRKIKKLEELGHINIVYEKRGCEIIKREIRLTKMLTDDKQKCQPTINKNVKDNITSNNIINNNKNVFFSNDKNLKENKTALQISQDGNFSEIPNSSVGQDLSATQSDISEKPNNLTCKKSSQVQKKETDEAFKKISNLYYEKETCRQDDYEIYQKTLNKGISVSKFEKEVHCYITARNNEQKIKKREILNNSNLTDEQKKIKIQNIFIPNKLNFKTFCNSLKKETEIYKDKFNETEKSLKSLEAEKPKKNLFQALYEEYIDNHDFFNENKTQKEIDIILKFKDTIKVQLENEIIEATDRRSGIGFTKINLDLIELKNLKEFQKKFYSFLEKYKNI